MQHAVGYITGGQFYGAKASLNVWPAQAGERAGARGGGGRAEAAEDLVQQLVRETADVVLPIPSLPAAVLHLCIGLL
jgi:hypothetical protein